MTVEMMHADALDFTPDILSDFDALICDPAYSEHVHANAASVGVTGGGLGAHGRDLGFESLSPELRTQIAIAAGCVKRWSAIFSDVEGAHLWREECARAGAEYIRPVPWIRWSQPQLSGDRPCTILEIISVFHAQYTGPRGGTKAIAKHWNGPGNIMPHVSRELLACLQDRALRGDDKHPTEKRLSQMLELVSWFSDPGERILDLCAGSGSTVLACRLLGRDCVGVELDAVWAAKAAIRVRAMLSPRDRADAEEWCERVITEAATTLETSDACHAQARKAIEALTAAGDTSSPKYVRACTRLVEDRNTRVRAEARLADVDRVMGAL